MVMFEWRTYIASPPICKDVHCVCTLFAPLKGLWWFHWGIDSRALNGRFMTFFLSYMWLCNGYNRDCGVPYRLVEKHTHLGYYFST